MVNDEVWAQLEICILNFPKGPLSPFNKSVVSRIRTASSAVLLCE